MVSIRPKKKWSPDTCSNMGGPWKHGAKRNKSIADMVHDSYCRHTQNRHSWGRHGLTANGHGAIMKVIVVMDVQFWDYVKNHWTVIFKLVNYLNLVTEAATINNGIKNISHLSTAFQEKRGGMRSMSSNHCPEHRENMVKIYYMGKANYKKYGILRAQLMNP